MSEQLSCLHRVKRASNGERPTLPTEVRRAKDLFDDHGQRVKPEMSRFKRPSTIRLPTGQIVERHGFVCPDCKDKFVGPSDLLAHYENDHATGFFPALKRYVREMPLGVKIGTLLAFPLGGLGGTAILLSGNEIVRQIKNRVNGVKAKKTDGR